VQQQQARGQQRFSVLAADADDAPTHRHRVVEDGADDVALVRVQLQRLADARAFRHLAVLLDPLDRGGAAELHGLMSSRSLRSSSGSSRLRRRSA
jgi:hypothetical protein